MSKKRQIGCTFIASKHVTASGASDLFIFFNGVRGYKPFLLAGWQAMHLFRGAPRKGLGS